VVVAESAAAAAAVEIVLTAEQEAAPPVTARKLTRRTVGAVAEDQVRLPAEPGEDTLFWERFAGAGGG
jgi:hypothetical protein